MIKNVSSCIIEKFRGFDIVSIEYGREQQTKFSLIDILHKPVKNGMILLIAIFHRTCLLLIELSFMQVKKGTLVLFNVTIVAHIMFRKGGIRNISKNVRKFLALCIILPTKTL